MLSEEIEAAEAAIMYLPEPCPRLARKPRGGARRTASQNFSRSTKSASRQYAASLPSLNESRPRLVRSVRYSDHDGDQDKTDWRLQGQERYLSGATLRR